MLKELIHDKINEIFVEYQKANNITNGDIDPFDALELDRIEDKLQHLIERVCEYQRKADARRTYYIYQTDDGQKHISYADSQHLDEFMTELSNRICFSDCTDVEVLEIYLDGKEIHYAGWQQGMKFEYKDSNGNTVWVGFFPEWDH